MKVYNSSSVPIGSKMKSSTNFSAHRQCQAQHIISRDSLFYSNHAVARQRVNLKLEACASESSPPSQSESSARALPNPDASTTEIFMNLFRVKPSPWPSNVGMTHQETPRAHACGQQSARTRRCASDVSRDSNLGT
jgi:hypothetical protein